VTEPLRRCVGSSGPRSSDGCERVSRRTALETLDEAARALASDTGALQRLVESTGPGLVRYAARILGSVADAEDAVQESYVKAYDALLAGRFDGRASLKTWLYRIVTRTAIDYRRSRATRERLLDVSSDASVDGPAAADALVALRELEGLLEELPEEQRSTLLLQAMEGFTNREIGEILGCSEGAVEQRLVRARATLKTKVSP
jgi:RNA polymerase sigma-70 factor (ECF subfamily)